MFLRKVQDEVDYILGNVALHTLLGLKATISDKDLRRGEAIGMGSREARHHPKANCNYMADFGIVSLRGTSMDFNNVTWVILKCFE